MREFKIIVQYIDKGFFMEEIEEKIVEKKTRTKSKTPEENISQLAIDRYGQVKGSGNILFLLSVLLLSLTVIIISGLWINTKYSVNTFANILDIFDIKVFVLMLSIFSLIQMVKSVTLFMSLYFRRKYNRFSLVYKAMVGFDYYGLVSIYSSTSNSFLIGSLVSNKVKVNDAVLSTYEKKYCDIFAFLTVSLIMIIVGAFKWQKYTHISFTLIGFFVVVVGFLYLVYIRMFRKDKELCLSISSVFAKLLTKLRIRKDYEDAYYSVIDKGLATSKSINCKFYVKCIDVVGAIVVLLLRASILYLLLSSLDVSGVEVYFKSLWIMVTVDLLVNVFPLPKGGILAELILLYVLSKWIVPEYIVWLIVGYKFFEVVLYAIQFGVVSLVDKIKNKNSNKKETI